MGAKPSKYSLHGNEDNNTEDILFDTSEAFTTSEVDRTETKSHSDSDDSNIHISSLPISDIPTSVKTAKKRRKSLIPSIRRGKSKTRTRSEVVVDPAISDMKIESKDDLLAILSRNIDIVLTDQQQKRLDEVLSAVEMAIRFRIETTSQESNVDGMNKEEHATLVDEIAALKEKCTLAEEKLSQTLQELDSLTHKKQLHKQHISDLKEHARILEHVEIANLVDQKLRLDQDLEQIMKTMTEKQKASEKEEMEMDQQLETFKSQMETQHRKYHTEKLKLESDIEQLNQRISDSENDHEIEFQKRRRDMEIELSTLKSRAESEINELREAHQLEKAKLDAELKQIEAKVYKNKEILQRQEESIKGQEEMAEKSVKLLSKLQEEIRTTDKHLKTKCASIDSDIASATSEILELRASGSTIRESIDKQRQEAKLLQDSINELSQQKNELLTAVEKENEILREVELNIAESKQQFYDWKNNMENCKSRTEDMLKQLNDSQHDLAFAEQQLSEVELLHESLQTAVDALSKEHLKLENLSESLSLQIKHRRQELEQSNMKREQNHCTQTLVIVRQELNARNAENKNLRDQIESMKRSLDASNNFKDIHDFKMPKLNDQEISTTRIEDTNLESRRNLHGTSLQLLNQLNGSHHGINVADHLDSLLDILDSENRIGSDNLAPKGSATAIHQAYNAVINHFNVVLSEKETMILALKRENTSLYHTINRGMSSSPEIYSQPISIASSLSGVFSLLQKNPTSRVKFILEWIGQMYQIIDQYAVLTDDIRHTTVIERKHKHKVLAILGNVVTAFCCVKDDKKSTVPIDELNQSRQPDKASLWPEL